MISLIHLLIHIKFYPVRPDSIYNVDIFDPYDFLLKDIIPKQGGLVEKGPGLVGEVGD